MLHRGRAEPRSCIAAWMRTRATKFRSFNGQSWKSSAQLRPLSNHIMCLIPALTRTVADPSLTLPPLVLRRPGRPVTCPRSRSSALLHVWRGRSKRFLRPTAELRPSATAAWSARAARWP
jgi:hypothetical protein